MTTIIGCKNSDRIREDKQIESNKDIVRLNGNDYDLSEIRKDTIRLDIDFINRQSALLDDDEEASSLSQLISGYSFDGKFIYFISSNLDDHDNDDLVLNKFDQDLGHIVSSISINNLIERQSPCGSDKFDNSSGCQVHRFLISSPENVSIATMGKGYGVTIFNHDLVKQHELSLKFDTRTIDFINNLISNSYYSDSTMLINSVEGLLAIKDSSVMLLDSNAICDIKTGEIFEVKRNLESSSVSIFQNDSLVLSYKSLPDDISLCNKNVYFWTYAGNDSYDLLLVNLFSGQIRLHKIFLPHSIGPFEFKFSPYSKGVFCNLEYEDRGNRSTSCFFLKLD